MVLNWLKCYFNDELKNNNTCYKNNFVDFIIKFAIMDKNGKVKICINKQNGQA